MAAGRAGGPLVGEPSGDSSILNCVDHGMATLIVNLFGWGWGRSGIGGFDDGVVVSRGLAPQLRLKLLHVGLFDAGEISLFVGVR